MMFRVYKKVKLAISPGEYAIVYCKARGELAWPSPYYIHPGADELVPCWHGLAKTRE